MQELAYRHVDTARGDVWHVGKLETAGGKGHMVRAGGRYGVNPVGSDHEKVRVLICRAVIIFTLHSPDKLWLYWICSVSII